VSARGQTGGFLAADQDAVAPIIRKDFKVVIRGICTADLLDVLDPHRYGKSVLEAARGDISYPAFVNPLPDVSWQSALCGFIGIIIRDHACQHFKQRGTGLGGDHTPGNAAVHAQVAQQHWQDLVGSEVNSTFIHDPKTVSISVHAHADLCAGLGDRLFEQLVEGLFGVGVILPAQIRVNICMDHSEANACFAK